LTVTIADIVVSPYYMAQNKMQLEQKYKLRTTSLRGKACIIISSNCIRRLFKFRESEMK